MFILLDINDWPIGIRETSQELLEIALRCAKAEILDSPDGYYPEEGEGLIAVPEYDGDRLNILVYTPTNRENCVAGYKALEIDPKAPIVDW